MIVGFNNSLEKLAKVTAVGVKEENEERKKQEHATFTSFLQNGIANFLLYSDLRTHRSISYKKSKSNVPQPSPIKALTLLHVLLFFNELVFF